MKKILHALILLALIGVSLSLYSLLHNKGLASGEFCTIGESLDCDVVNRGPYSVFLGIPVALLGVIGYGFILIGAIAKQKNHQDRELTTFLLLASGAALLFSLYLTSLEAFVLKAWCLLCVTSQTIILLITILTGRLYHLEKK